MVHRQRFQVFEVILGPAIILSVILFLKLDYQINRCFIENKMAVSGQCDFFKNLVKNIQEGFYLDCLTFSFLLIGSVLSFLLFLRCEKNFILWGIMAFGLLIGAFVEIFDIHNILPMIRPLGLRIDVVVKLILLLMSTSYFFVFLNYLKKEHQRYLFFLIGISFQSLAIFYNFIEILEVKISLGPSTLLMLEQSLELAAAFCYTLFVYLIFKKNQLHFQH